MEGDFERLEVGVCIVDVWLAEGCRDAAAADAVVLFCCKIATIT